MEKHFILHVGKTGTNKSLWDIQIYPQKDNERGFVYKAKLEVVEYDKKGKDANATFYFSLDDLHVLADDIYHCTFNEWNGWEKQEDKSKLHRRQTSYNGFARELNLKIFQNPERKKGQPTGKYITTLGITVKEGTAKYPDQKISPIDYTKPYKSRMTQADISLVRVEMKKIITFIEALAVNEVVRSDINNLNAGMFKLWNVNELKEKGE